MTYDCFEFAFLFEYKGLGKLEGGDEVRTMILLVCGMTGLYVP